MKTNETQQIVLKKEFSLTNFTDYDMKIISHIIVFSLGMMVQQLSAQMQILPHQSGFYQPTAGVCLSSSQRQMIKHRLTQNVETLKQQGIIQPVNTRNNVVLEWPLKANDDYEHYDYHGISNFVDHDTDFPERITDYNCGERSYDTGDGYNHPGTDIFLWPFAWNLMRANQIRVVAAAPGIIIDKMDGEPDQNCDLSTFATWNAIFIRHEDGSQAWYGHLKMNSLTPKSIGDSVETGDFLGFVGSSGISNGPHLHLEIYDAEDNLIDPFEGECGQNNHHSWWQEQRSYYDSGLNRMGTYAAAPEFSECPDEDIIHDSNEFCGGDTIYFSVFLRDQLANQVLRHQIRQPDGSLVVAWPSAEQDISHFPASYSIFPIIIPKDAPIGDWTYQVEYLDKTYNHTFSICQSVPTHDISIDFPRHSILPNPVKQDFEAMIHIYISGTFEFEIRDLMGRRLQKRKEMLIEGQHQLGFSVGNLPSGLYLLTISDEKQTRVAQKFVKD